MRKILLIGIFSMMIISLSGCGTTSKDTNSKENTAKASSIDESKDKNLVNDESNSNGKVKNEITNTKNTNNAYARGAKENNYADWFNSLGEQSLSTVTEANPLLYLTFSSNLKQGVFSNVYQDIGTAGEREKILIWSDGVMKNFQVVQVDAEISGSNLIFHKRKVLYTKVIINPDEAFISNMQLPEGAPSWIITCENENGQEISFSLNYDGKGDSLKPLYSIVNYVKQ